MNDYRNRTVLVTGHTGFKGSWLALWLHSVGAHVIGYSLPSPTEPSHFNLIKLENKITHVNGDVRDFSALKKCLADHRPEIIFHLAAQPIVIASYENPRETFDTNAMGTVNLLEACRYVASVKAVVVVTSDKCYDNDEREVGFHEEDRLGGKDPYSASKAISELIVSSYRSSFFNKPESSLLLATVRAGNVVGGGDFSTHRIVPDAIKAFLEGKPVFVRNPESTRPWLYVLEALYGYLLLGIKLLNRDEEFAEAWNFGPSDSEVVNVRRLIEKMVVLWGEGGAWQTEKTRQGFKEMGILRLNSSKAVQKLGWKSSLQWEEALTETVHWYKAYQQYVKQPLSVNLMSESLQAIERYNQKAGKHATGLHTH